jgi:hypothetical protein
MAAVIDATVGGTSSNSYSTVALGTVYFDERLQSAAWATTDDQTRALIMATRRIDEEDFGGWRNTDAQALKWPRDGATVDGVDLSTTAIPDIVIRATYELALVLLTKDDASEDFLANSGLEAFENVKVGPLDVTPRISHMDGDLPEEVYRLLAPVLRSSRLTGALVRA